MADVKNIFDYLSKKNEKDLLPLLPYINRISVEINDVLNDPSVDKLFFVYLLQDRIIKIFDYLPNDKKEEMLYALMKKLEEVKI